MPTAIQLGGTALELDPATVSRLVAAAALLGLAAAGGALASDVFLFLTAVVAVIQLGIEVTLTAAGIRNDDDDER